MSTINIAYANAQIAPAFPPGGALALNFQDVVKQRGSHQNEIGQCILDARAQKQYPPCMKALHISLFFDGTNNNRYGDDLAKPVSSSNVARLYHATIGSREARIEGYYSYYMQGVGTSFDEIGEYGPSSSGLQFATGGEARICWGLTRVVDALMLAHSENQHPLPLPRARQAIKAMQTVVMPVNRAHIQSIPAKQPDRQAAMRSLMQPVLDKIAQRYRPMVIAIKLYVYGFSRGAAEARCFVNRLQELLDTQGQFYGMPISIEFLGLMDTVASVGLAPVVGGASGHDGWGDDMKLPADTQLLKRCAHLVSAHEQRLCFPLDSICSPDGAYPASTLGEWVYPGVHSDVGGGYPPGEQGKALLPATEGASRASRQQQGLLLSQIPLHHMYQLAFAAGAPLQVSEQFLINAPADTLAELKRRESWRFMDQKVATDLFVVYPELIERFEAWRQAASGSAPLDQILMRQLEQITAWRIERYAGGLSGSGGVSQADSRYLADAQEQDEATVRAHEKAWQRANAKINSAAVKEAALGLYTNIPKPLPQAEPLPDGYRPDITRCFEPTRDRSQLQSGADDFRGCYLNGTHLQPGNLGGMLFSIGMALARPLSDDAAQEYPMIKRQAEQQFDRVTRNSALMALYDQHVHDSRAWFMQSALGKSEPFASYFRYRTVYCGTDQSMKVRDVQQQAAEKTRAVPLNCAPDAAPAGELPHNWLASPRPGTA